MCIRDRCTRCDLGRFGANATCTECDAGRFADARGSTECAECPSGKIANPQSTACENPSWTTAADCTVNQYLDDRKNKSEWSCEACPEGVSCRGEIARSNIEQASVLFGWARCPTSNISAMSSAGSGSSVEECPFRAACLGASNQALFGKYLSLIHI